MMPGSFTLFVHASTNNGWNDGSWITSPPFNDDAEKLLAFPVVDQCAHYGIWQESDTVYYALGGEFDAKRLFTATSMNWY